MTKVRTTAPEPPVAAWIAALLYAAGVLGLGLIAAVEVVFW